MVREVKLSITRSWVQNLSLPHERSNRETSRRIGFCSVYLVSLQDLPYILIICHIYRLTSAPLISIHLITLLRTLCGSFTNPLLNSADLTQSPTWKIETINF